MNTKHENLYTSEEPVQKSDKSIHEVMKQALEALELIQTDVDWQLNSPTRKFCRKAEKALRQAIEQAENQTHTDHPLRHYDRTCPACLSEEPEPVAWMCAYKYDESDTEVSWVLDHASDGVEYMMSRLDDADNDAWRGKPIPLYTAPQTDSKVFDDMVELYEAQLDAKANRIAELEKTRKWQNLTDDEKLDVIAYQPHPMMDKKWIINAVEAKLKERNK